MKAITYNTYGTPEVFNYEEVEKPSPKDDEVLIRIIATAANSGDARLRKADPWAVRLFFGLTKPRRKILGSVLSGEVEAAGKNVTKFKVGDKVFGATGMMFGAYAEYICLPEDGILAIKPGNISHIEASTIPFGATTALHFLKKVDIKRGQRILIYGASGAVGSAAVQLAKYYGAHVTAVGGPSSVELMKKLGADVVLDYTKDNFTSSGVTYDLVYDTVNKLSFKDSIIITKPGGTLILGAAGSSEMLQGALASITGKRKVMFGVISQMAAQMDFLKGLVEAGHYVPVVDRVYALKDMTEAHRYIEGGHKKGNVPIVVAESR